MKKDLEKKNNIVPAIIGLGALAGFISVTVMVVSTGVIPLDTAVRESIYSLRNPGLNTLMETLTLLGNWQTITILCLLLLAYPQYRFDYGIPVSAVAVVSVAVNKLIKITIARPRPEDVAHLIDESGFSFASGHSASTMAVFLLLIYLIVRNGERGRKPKVLIWVLALAIPVVGFSRIYLGVHYPTDVLGGWLEGIFLVCLTVIVLNIMGERRILYQ